MRKIRWTNKEIRILKRMYKNNQNRLWYISKFINNRSFHSINNKRILLGLKRKKAPSGINLWSHKQIIILKKEYPNRDISLKQLSKKIKKTLGAIHYKSNLLGLHRNNWKYNSKEINILKKLYSNPNYTKKDLILKLNRDYMSIRSFACKLGLKRPKKMSYHEQIVKTFFIMQGFRENYDFIFNERLAKTKFKPDFLFPNYKIIIEVDGQFWHSKSEMIKKDRRKLYSYHKLGYKVHRITDKFLERKPHIAFSKLTNLFVK